MKAISKNAIIGYPAGIITGITYGLNPLFGIPLMNNGASIESILFFRYGIAVLILGSLLLLVNRVSKFPESKPESYSPSVYYTPPAVYSSLKHTSTFRPDWQPPSSFFIRSLSH